MYIKQLQLRNYRNYAELGVRIDEGLNFIIGRNAAGKTNLLESIYFLEQGKSHRTNTNQDLIKWNEDFCIVQALVQRADRELKVEATVSKTGAKQLKVNGVVFKAQVRARPIRTVIFTPDHLKIVKEMPEHRRAYLDEVLEKLKPDYAYWRGQYGKILKQRNVLLKKIAGGRMKRDVVDYWDEQLIPAGSRIIAARKALVGALQEHARPAYKKITASDAELDLMYENQLLKDGAELEGISERFRDMLQQRRGAEIERGQTLVGPHRDDVGIFSSGIDLRTFGSQGEQRSASLALKIAELAILSEKEGELPILLLDDVLSELDRSRQRALLAHVKSGMQVIITSTNAEHVDELGADDATIITIE